MLITSILHNSSWLTSAIAADTRFMTLCNFSQTGDIREMILAMASTITKVKATKPEMTLSYGNAQLLRLAIEYTQRPI
jgi:archaeosine-15-forming tRNA-guanine transglycosylase